MPQRTQALFIACLAFVACATPPHANEPPYRNATLPTETRVRDLLGRMTLEEKFWQLFMVPGDPLAEGKEKYRHGAFGIQLLAARERGEDARRQTAAAARDAAEQANAAQRFFVTETRLGIPIIVFEEAAHGLIQEGATSYPQAIALAATWDSALMGNVAGAMAREARSRGIRQVLSPVINIANDVRWGRVEETFGEDPFLSSVMALAFVRPLERAGVITTPKHFVANVGDGGRDSYPIDFNERLLEEVFFPPFRAAIREGGATSLMSSYNSVNGAPASQSRWLLTTKLRDEWGFGGFVISDQAAVGGANVLHFTSPNTSTSAAQAFEAGLDVVFQSSVDQYRPYWDAVQRGMVSTRTLDAAVARVLRAKFTLGLFEHPYVDPDEAARLAGGGEFRAVAFEAARRSITLLKNDGRTLPLSRSLGSVAVIGTDAVEARLGGYSSLGNAKRSVLDGIKRQLGTQSTVRYAPGPGRITPEVVAVPSASLASGPAGARVPGLTGEYFDNNRLEGSPRVTRTDDKVDFGWTLNAPARGIPFDWYSVRWTGKLIGPATGTVQLGVEGNDGYRLWFDGRLVIDNWRKQSFRTTLTDVQLERGREHDLRLEYFESTGNARVKLVWSQGAARDWQVRIDEAVRAAEASEAAIVVAGVEEGEFRDRSSLALPGHQEQLITAVAAALAARRKPLVVVIVGGSAVTMRGWLDRTPAVLDAWYPGEAGGDAVADVIFGEYNPGGRLPVTFPIAEGQLPLVYNHKPTGRGDDYLDLTGQPLFPFGFGLSYTTFEYSALSITPVTIGPGGHATVRCKVRNSGQSAGDEVAQLYLRDVVASVPRPVMELAGFRRVHLAPGEEIELAFELTPAELGLLDIDLKRVVEPGTFRVMVGASSKDIRLRGMLEVR